MKLFERREVVGASGSVLPWVIDFDAIPDDVVTEIARIVVMTPFFPEFERVVGVPKGTSPKSRVSLDNGARLEKAFLPHITYGARLTLLVDDVWTTGGSMRACAKNLGLSTNEWGGFVVYARERIPPGWNVRAFWKFGL